MNYIVAIYNEYNTDGIDIQIADANVAYEIVTRYFVPAPKGTNTVVDFDSLVDYCNRDGIFWVNDGETYITVSTMSGEVLIRL